MLLLGTPQITQKQEFHTMGDGVRDRGEYTYGWYSSSGERCKAIKESQRFIVVSIIVDQILLARTSLLGISL